MQNRIVTYIKTVIKYCQDILLIFQKNENSYDTFVNDKAYQYSASFCIEQIGETAKKLRDLGFSDKYPDIPWNEICAMRNRIAHGYDAIDVQMVFDICTIDVPDLLKRFEDILDIEK